MLAVSADEAGVETRLDTWRIRMSKTKAITLACCTLIAGLVCGGWSTGVLFASYVKFTAQGNKAVPYVGTAWNLRDLENLRNGDTNSAIESLESQLDGNLVELWIWNKDTPAGKRDAHLLKLLSKVRDYRTEYPRAKQLPEIERTVAEVLSWGGSKQKP
jgi:hypothetical protein